MRTGRPRARVTALRGPQGRSVHARRMLGVPRVHAVRTGRPARATGHVDSQGRSVDARQMPGGVGPGCSACPGPMPCGICPGRVSPGCVASHGRSVDARQAPGGLGSAAQCARGPCREVSAAPRAGRRATWPAAGRREAGARPVGLDCLAGRGPHLPRPRPACQGPPRPRPVGPGTSPPTAPPGVARDRTFHDPARRAQGPSPPWPRPAGVTAPAPRPHARSAQSVPRSR